MLHMLFGSNTYAMYVHVRTFDHFLLIFTANFNHYVINVAMATCKYVGSQLCST